MRRFSRRTWLLAGPTLVVAALALADAGCASRAAGVVDGHLAPYEERANGVSSRSVDPGHRIEPLRYAGGVPEGRRLLLAALSALPRTAVVEDRGDYLHVTATSLIWRFTDDLEFLFAAPGEIEARSCARLGYSDFGVNRGRIERIRRLMGAPGQSAAK